MSAGRGVRGMLAMALVAGAVACGGSPAAPGPPAVNVAGAWAGTWQFVTAGTTVTDTVSVSLAQNGSSVTGTWASPNGPSGQVSFTAAASIAGSFSFTQTTLTGQTCSASTTLVGTASAANLDFTTNDVVVSGLCQWATGNRFALHR